jgi:hypothetical protein
MTKGVRGSFVDKVDSSWCYLIEEGAQTLLLI